MGSSDFRLDQAIYGSRSGDRDYRLLAASPGVCRAERDLLEQHANLGGTALTAATVEPIYAAFPLDASRGRHAFLRATVLGRGARGNEYLAHALILSRVLFETLRGDLFLLADAGWFSDAKPEGDDLPAPEVEPARFEVASRRPCGVDRPAGIELDALAPFLSALLAGPLAVPVADGALAVAVCRSVLSTVPPEDRAALSFTSRFCQPRALPYRFAAFVPDDRALAERFLRGAVRPLGADIQGDAASEPIREWLAAAAVGIEPVSGLSLLADPAGAIARVRFLQALPEDGEPGPSPGLVEETLRRADARDVEIARHPANAALPRLGGLVVGLLAHGLEQSARAALDAGDPAGLFAESEKSIATVDPGDLVAELAGQGGLAARTARIAVALAARDADLLRAVGTFARGDGPTWIERLLVSAPGFALPFLTSYFSALREADGPAALPSILGSLASFPVDVALQPALAAVERAAPSGPAGERRAWFLAYLHLLRKDLGTRVPSALAARIAGQEGLLDSMGAEELLPLLPELAASFPQLLDHDRLAALPDPVLEALLAIAARSVGTGSAAWDLARRPERARIVERLATRVADRLAAPERPGDRLARTALELIGSGARRVEVDRAPLLAALAALLAACPTGLTARAVRAAALLGRSLGPLPRFEPRVLAAIRAAACRDARESALRGKGWPVLIWLEALTPRASRL